MNIIGYSYQQERSFDTLEGAATSESSGSSSLLGAGIGLGIGAGIGSAVGNQFSGIAKEINTVGAPTKNCPQCHNVIEGNMRFCPSCSCDIQKSTVNKNTGDDAKCSACGVVMPNGAKFCSECGTALVKKCGKCGTVIKGNPKFCPECGEKLE